MNKNKYKILLILAFVILNIFLLPSAGTSDVRTWEGIMGYYHQINLNEFVSSCLNYQCPTPTNYPPLHIIIAFLFAKILPLNLIGSLLTVKIMILLFFLLSLFILIFFNKGIRNINKSNSLNNLDLALIYLSCFSIIFNAQGLGYTDVLLLPFFVLTILFLFKNKFILTGLFYSLSFLIKWQPLILLPLIIIYILMLKSPKLLFVNLIHFIFGLLIPFPFLFLLNNNIIYFLSTTFKLALTDQILSAALNTQWIVTYFLHFYQPYLYGPFLEGFIEYISYFNGNFIPHQLLILPKLLFFSIYSLILLRFVSFNGYGQRYFYNFLFTSYVIYTSYFMISSAVHENHLFLAVILALLLFILHPTRINRLLLLATDIIAFINMFIYYGFTGQPVIPRVVNGVDITLYLAIIFSLLYFILLFNYLFPSFPHKLQKIQRGN